MTDMTDKQRARLGMGPRPPKRRFDDCCNRCGYDLDYDKLFELFVGVRLEKSKRKSVRYACPECGSISRIELDISFVVEATGMRKKIKKKSPDRSK